MPATEQTWRDQKLLHVVFGATSLVLLITTVLMFAADHAREWKGYQRKFRRAEERLTAWNKRAVDSADYRQEIDKLQEQLAEAQAQAVPAEAVAKFRAAVIADAERRGAKVDVDVNLAEATEAELSVASDEAARLQAEAQELKSQADAAWQQVATLRTEEADSETMEAAEQQARQADQAAQAATASADAATSQAATIRQRLIDWMARGTFGEAREDEVLSRRKFKAADLDKLRADLDILVRDNRLGVEAEAKQAQIDATRKQLDELTLAVQAAIAHRNQLDRLLKSVTDSELELGKQLEASQGEMARLEATIGERDLSYFTSTFPWLGKKWLTIPILDAFNSPLTIDNLWTENLTMPQGSFGQVRRFDRCTTCHRGIDKTAPGAADEPAYLSQRFVELDLITPPSRPESTFSPRGEEIPPTLLSVYGIRLASAGLFNRNDVTIDYVQPQSLASHASVVVDESSGTTEPGLQVGDVILAVNGDRVNKVSDVHQLLFTGIDWGQPLRLSILRGIAQPFTSHPRLDLFVGSLSPHKLSTFGCTSCHDGQGSSTSFKWASHTPNDPQQAKQWAREHGWFNNHHWIFPMYAQRFMESACLKCHHNVTELEPSERFPDPPAPKLVKGFHVIADYGCFGCHEINGFDGPNRRIGPDMRLEPNYFAAAAALLADPGLAQLDPSAPIEAAALVEQPTDKGLRHSLRELVLADRESETPVLTSESHAMAEVLQDIETPGTYRKVGPSLRHVASKLDAAFMYDWIRQPSHFRPSTKMPQFFGQWDHLRSDPDDLAVAERYEPVEILGTVRYLLDRSQSFEFLTPESSTAAPSAERGKLAFEIRGCLACHQHADFPQSVADQGPNLTGLGDKFAAGDTDARAWLYSWLKQPTHYSPRTLMPDLQLEPYEDKEGNSVDPIADIAEYLLSSSTGWQPAADVAQTLTLDTPQQREALDDLVLEYLNAAFPRAEAKEYLQTGIPPQLASTLKGAEQELVGGASLDQKLAYIGRKTIAKYGCYGCHDIPGFEDANPVGTALADWGRKESAQLAFEHIAEYLHQGHGAVAPGAGGHTAATAGQGEAAPDHGSSAVGAHPSDHAVAASPADGEPIDESFYVSQIHELGRAGFIWQKLKEPRSYDFKKAHNKGYNEWLRMPRFPLNPQQREAVVTFVLGLVADPPADEFVFQGTPRRNAITQGWAVIQRFNCAGCHMFEPEQWDIEFEEGLFPDPPDPPDFPFVQAHFSREQLLASATPDLQRGVFRASLRGVPALRNQDGLQEVLDKEGDPIDPEDRDYYSKDDPRYDAEEDPAPFQYPFVPWEPAVIAGQVYNVGLMRLVIPEENIVRKRPSVGGDLTWMLLPRVVELEQQDNPAANGSEAWSWLPPPLMGEGNKVQPDWLYNFLLDPHLIRPAVFLRMPRFNLSPEEARKIVNYFAARDNAQYPFEYTSRTSVAHLERMEAQFEQRVVEEGTRFDHAMNIITDANYCIKCHLIGDFAPEGSVRALAPDLAIARDRLRPEFTRQWIAKPTSILPYTPMPVNIPYETGVSQALFAGTSTEQVDAVVDLLMNYGLYASSHIDIEALVKAAAAAAANTTAPAANPAEPSTTDAATSFETQPGTPSPTVSVTP